MATYYDRLAVVLSYKPQTIPQLMKAMNLRSHKTTYVIAALRKGVKNGVFERVEKSGVKTKFVGHAFKFAKQHIKKASSGKGKSTKEKALRARLHKRQ